MIWECHSPRGQNRPKAPLSLGLCQALSYSAFATVPAYAQALRARPKKARATFDPSLE